jgi:inhibitor of cysteine peptidase
MAKSDSPTVKDAIAATRWCRQLAAAIVSALLAACSLPSQPEPTAKMDSVVVAPDPPGGRIELALGQELVVRLPGNPSTGYRWSLAAAPAGPLEATGSPAFERAQTASQVGAGGHEVWKFKSIQKGQDALRFEYRRPWEKDVPAAQTASYQVTLR